MDLRNLIARARGAFLGLAVGDALGATTEFMTPTEVRARFGIHRKMIGGGWLRLKPGQVTDDTAMSVALSRSVLAAGGWDVRSVAEGMTDSSTASIAPSKSRSIMVVKVWASSGF